MKIAIIGMGTMGTAIQQKLSGGDFEVIGLDREDDKSTVSTAEVIILAVKPQSFGEVAEELKAHIDKQLVISIMAGVSVSTLISRLGTKRIVRTMPNLALTTGQSLTAWHAKLNDEDIKMAERLISAWGSALRLENEEQFHAFTALAGSGPAYFFQLAYLLELAAFEQGFSQEQARTISLQTFRGAASVLSDDEISCEALVKRVASRGGTTEVALAVFERHSMHTILNEAVAAAAERSVELGH
jgi:pyrroline-5-carboxylate reductase